MTLIAHDATQQLDADPDSTMLGHLPEHQRGQILSGMRWTVWLSAIAAPFSLAISFLLARVGPDTLGVYGLLGVYVALTSALMYFGGDSVIMRFIPDCRDDDRASFLISYLIVILAVIGGWLVFAWFCPAAMRLALGNIGGDRFHFLILCLAPVPIIFAMVIACLKGMLEIRASQVLAKLATITSLVIYAALFVFDRALLSAHPLAVVWSVYLGLTAILSVVGGVRIIRLFHARRARWYLPDGFWRYAIHTQQVSFTSFFASKLDYVLIVGFGGLALLGKYVAVMAVAATIWTVSWYFVDTLMPALTNTIAARNYAGAAQVFTMHARILFLFVTAAACTIMVLAVPATEVLGPKYASLSALIILMTLYFGVACSGGFGGIVLSSIGRQQLGVWTNILNVCLFGGLFSLLWQRWGLTGAIIANGTALVISRVVLMVLALRTARFLPSIFGLWVRATVVQSIVAFVAWWWMPIGFVTAALLWLGAMLLFLWSAHYTFSECKNVIRMFLPGSATGMNSDPTESAMEDET